MKTAKNSKSPAGRPELDMQLAINDEAMAAAMVPDQETVEGWLDVALQDLTEPVELTVRVVDEEESALLNSTYRHKDGPTNVLSFPFEQPPGVNIPLLGDLVICAAVVAREAKEQGKAPLAHWAHMVVHGCLHLMGHDHQTETEAAAMEAKEIAILRQLGFTNPYVIN